MFRKGSGLLIVKPSRNHQGRLFYLKNMYIDCVNVNEKTTSMKKVLFPILFSFLFSVQTVQGADIAGAKADTSPKLHRVCHGAVVVDSATPAGSVKVSSDGQLQATAGLAVTGAATVSTTLGVTGVVTGASYSVANLGTAPASATAAGTKGTIVFAVDAIYVCTATNTWKKIAIATF